MRASRSTPRMFIHTMQSQGVLSKNASLALEFTANRLPTQHPLNERIYILVSHLNRNLVTIIRINNCPRVSAMSVDDLSHAPRLIGISPVVLGAVQNQRFRFYIL